MKFDASLKAKRGNPAAMNRRASLAMTVLVAFLCLPELALLGFFTTGALLSAPAGALRTVDAVVVLGGDGGMGGRYVRGARSGAGRVQPAVDPALPQRRADQRCQGQGAGRGDCGLDAGPGSSGSWGEALAVRERMQAEGLRSVMVVSDPPHMLRLRYTWGSVLRGTGLDYTLVATSPPWWPGWRWWRNPGASDFVGNEVLKLGYYVVRYRFGW
jgi:hypothetical protein